MNISLDSALNIMESDDFQFPMIIKNSTSKIKKRRFAHNVDNRIMSKRGRINISLNKIPKKSIRYVRDLFNTLVNMRWRWIMLTVALVNVTAYLIFANMFLLDAWVSGDFEDDPDHTHITCIRGIHNYTSFFMLGIETITTTGYGYFHPTEFCQLVFVVLTFSTLVTIFIDGAFISVVYVKISRPTYVMNYSLFSKKAVICMRNGRLCLIFRINDRTGKHWISSQVKLFLMKDHVTPEGEFIPNFIHELNLQPYGTLFWPVEIVHEITPDSPLWTTSAQDLMGSKFELLVMLLGSSVLTGQSSKSQTSYLSKEILWGCWYLPCIDESADSYDVDRKKFNRTVSVDTPLCSAETLDSIEREIGDKRFLVEIPRIRLDGGVKVESNNVECA